MRRVSAALLIVASLSTLACSGLFTIRSREVEAQDMERILEIDELIAEQGLDPSYAEEKEPVDIRAGMDIFDGWRVTYDFKGEKVKLYHEVVTYLKLSDATDHYDIDVEYLGLGAVLQDDKEEVELDGQIAWGEQSVCKHYLEDGQVTGLTCAARKGKLYFLFEVQGIDPVAAGGIDGLLGDRIAAVDTWVPEGVESGIEVDTRR